MVDTSLIITFNLHCEIAELTSNGLHETRYKIGDNSLVPENAYETDLSIHYHN